MINIKQVRTKSYVILTPWLTFSKRVSEAKSKVLSKKNTDTPQARAKVEVLLKIVLYRLIFTLWKYDRTRNPSACRQNLIRTNFTPFAQYWIEHINLWIIIKIEFDIIFNELVNTNNYIFNEKII